MTPAQALKVQALKAQILDDLLYATSDFDDPDEDINGADFVDGFSNFRRAAVERIRRFEHESE